MYICSVTASPQIAALFLALLQLGTPVASRAENDSAVERSDTWRANLEELEAYRSEWSDAIQESDSTEDALLEIIGSYDLVDFLTLANSVEVPAEFEPEPEPDRALRLMSSIPRSYRNSAGGLLSSLTRIEDVAKRISASEAARKSAEAATRDSKFDDPEWLYGEINELAFGVKIPSALQARIRSALMFAVATIVAGKIARDADALAPERLRDFFETWGRLASETATSAEVVAVILRVRNPDEPEAKKALEDIVHAFERHGLLMDALVRDAEAELSPYEPPRMGPIGEETT